MHLFRPELKSPANRDSACGWCLPGRFDRRSMIVVSWEAGAPDPDHTKYIAATTLGGVGWDLWREQRPHPLELLVRRTTRHHELQHYLDACSTTHGLLLTMRLHLKHESAFIPMLAKLELDGAAGRSSSSGELDRLRTIAAHLDHSLWLGDAGGEFCCETCVPAPPQGVTAAAGGVAFEVSHSPSGFTVEVPVVLWSAPLPEGWVSEATVVDCTAIYEALGLHIQRLAAWEAGYLAAKEDERTAQLWERALTSALTGSLVELNGPNADASFQRWLAGRPYEALPAYLRGKGVSFALEDLFAAAEHALMHDLPLTTSRTGVVEVVPARSTADAAARNVGARLVGIARADASIPFRSHVAEEVFCRTQELMDALRLYWRRTSHSQQYVDGIAPMGPLLQQTKVSFRVLLSWIRDAVAWLPFRQVGALSAAPAFFVQHVQPPVEVVLTTLGHDGGQDEPAPPGHLVGHGWSASEAADALLWDLTLSLLRDLATNPGRVRCPLRHSGGEDCLPPRPRSRLVVLEACASLLERVGAHDCGTLPAEGHPPCPFDRAYREVMHLPDNGARQRWSLPPDPSPWIDCAEEDLDAAARGSEGPPLVHRCTDVDRVAALRALHSARSRHERYLWPFPLQQDDWPWSDLVREGAAVSVALTVDPSQTMGWPCISRVVFTEVTARVVEALARRTAESSWSHRQGRCRTTLDPVGNVYLEGRPVARVTLGEDGAAGWVHFTICLSQRPWAAPWVASAAGDELADLLLPPALAAHAAPAEAVVRLLHAVLHRRTPAMDSEWREAQFRQRVAPLIDRPARIDATDGRVFVGRVGHVDRQWVHLEPAWKGARGEPLEALSAVELPVRYIQSLHVVHRKPTLIGDWR